MKLRTLALMGGMGLILPLAFLAGCGPSNEDTVRDFTRQLLTNNSSKMWFLDSLQRGTGSYSFAPDCDRDDRYIFNASGAFTFEENTACGGPSPEPKSSGTFELLNSGTDLKLNYTSGGSGASKTMKIVLMQSNRMVTQMEEGGVLVNRIYKVTF